MSRNPDLTLFIHTHIILNGTFTLANENYVVVYFRCSLGLNPPVQAG